MTTATNGQQGRLSPAADIRRYLDEHVGGTVEVPFHNLLTSWAVEEPTALDRQEMVAELTAAGVKASRPLGELAPDDVVTLSLSPLSTATPPVWLNGSATPAAGLPPTPTAPGYPMVGSSPPPPRPGRRLRIALAIVGVLLLVAGACVGAFFFGQGTRFSDSEVADKLERQAAHDKRVFTERTDRALATQKRRLTRQRKRAVAAAERRAREAGYTSGQSAGYASGNAAGYSAGHSTGVDEGVEEGLERGSDELTCSDDMDVPLPACDF